MEIDQPRAVGQLGDRSPIHIHKRMENSREYVESGTIAKRITVYAPCAVVPGIVGILHL